MKRTALISLVTLVVFTLLIAEPALAGPGGKIASAATGDHVDTDHRDPDQSGIASALDDIANVVDEGIDIQVRVRVEKP